MNRTLLLLIPVAALGLGYGIFRGPTIDWDLANVPPGPGRIVAFGDSLTRGKGAPPERCYPEELARILGREVENLGVNGLTTRRALDTLDPVLERAPAIVILTLGGNDILRKQPREETFGNLDQIFSRLVGAGSLVVYAAIDPPFVSGDWVDGIRQRCEQHGVLYVPEVMDGMWLDRSLMSDSIHPNAEGYALIAERVAERLQPVLE